MPCKSKRSAAGSRNSQKRRKHGAKKRHVTGVAADSPIKSLNKAQAGAAKRTERPDSTCAPKIKPFSSVVSPAQYEETKEEKRARVVLRFKILEAMGEMQSDRIADFAAQNGIHKKTLMSWVNRFMDGRSLADKPRSGAPNKQEKVLNLMKEQAALVKYCFTYRTMASTLTSLSEEAGTPPVSRSTVMNVIKKQNWRIVKIATRPLLTPENMQARKEWCRDRLNKNSTPEIWRLHLDEKWFYAFFLNKILYLPPGVEPPVQKIKSKRFIPKVMFLACVGMPTTGFDGCVGLWPVTEPKIAKRSSKHRPKGTVEQKSITMGKEVFMKMMKEHLLPRIVEKLKDLSTNDLKKLQKIEIQMDNAPGHAPKSCLEELNSYFQSKINESFDGLEIQIVCQPPNSPDLNLLDLGAWRSLQTAVERVKDSYFAADDDSGIESKLMKAVAAAWQQWESEQTLTDLTAVLFLFMQSILDREGGNDFRQPHASKKLRI